MIRNVIYFTWKALQRLKVKFLHHTKNIMYKILSSSHSLYDLLFFFSLYHSHDFSNLWDLVSNSLSISLYVIHYFLPSRTLVPLQYLVHVWFWTLNIFFGKFNRSIFKLLKLNPSSLSSCLKLLNFYISITYP